MTPRPPPPLERLFGPLRFNPTAVITAFNSMALAVLDRLMQLGIRVPADVSVVNINGRPLCPCQDIDLTATVPPTSKMAEKIVELLTTPGEEDHVDSLLYEPALHVGNTSGPCSKTDASRGHTHRMKSGAAP